MDWLGLLAVQWTLKSLLQHHSSKASVLWLSFLHSPTLTSIHDRCMYVQICSHWHFSSHYLFFFFCIVYNCRRRKWQPTPEFLPGKSHGRRSLVGCCLWGRTELDTTEATWQQQQQHLIRAQWILGDWSSDFSA